MGKPRLALNLFRKKLLVQYSFVKNIKILFWHEWWSLKCLVFYIFAFIVRNSTVKANVGRIKTVLLHFSSSTSSWLAFNVMFPSMEVLNACARKEIWNEENSILMKSFEQWLDGCLWRQKKNRLVWKGFYLFKWFAFKVGIQTDYRFKVLWANEATDF